MIVPQRFEHASLEDWEPKNPLRRAMDEYLDHFAEYFSQGRAPVFFGSSGAGKSRAASALLRTIASGSTVPLTLKWVPASEKFNEMLDAKDLRNTELFYSYWTGMKTADLIVLDDISTLRSSPRLLEYFWILLEARYSNLRSTIITGNFENLKADNLWEALAKWFSAPISRRIRETGKGLTVLL